MRRIGTVVAAVSIASATLPLFSQPQATQPAFEAASIKPFKLVPGMMLGSGCRGWDNPSFHSTGFQIALGRCRISGGTLEGLIKDYFGGGASSTPQDHFSVTGLKAWMSEDRFVIDAKADESAQATSKQLLQMMQTFIVQQFHLKYHLETKEVSGFNLVVAKDGPKWTALGESDPSTPGFAGRGELTGQTDPARLARVISERMGVPVSDQTGLTDRFAVNLKWSPQPTDRDYGVDPGGDPAGPSIFNALQEQLGLKLIPAKIPVQIFVVDSAERPTLN